MMKVSRGASTDRYYIFKLFGYGVFVHHIHHSDRPHIFHSHPWNGVSFIFGRYVEYWSDGKEAQQVFVRRGFHYVRAAQHHNVAVSKPVWTVFIHGRKCNSWSVINLATSHVSIAPWEGVNGFKDYEKTIQAGRKK